MKIFGKNLLLIFLIFSIFETRNIESTDYKNSKNSSVIKEQNSLKVPKYKLGPGDRISLKIFKTEDFNTVISVLPDGTINLPRIGALNVWGLTIHQTEKEIKEKYKEILRNPIIYIDLVSTRDVRIVVSGEVQRPGIYSIGLNSMNKLSNTDGGESSVITSKGWPTVVEAIQKAGGVTANGDLRNIELKRGNNDDNLIVLNYWEALSKGISVNNPYIYDGDSIKINTTKSRGEEESLKIAGSSFSPASITVNVIGEVKQPGLKQIRANSPLNLAIFSAGGLNENSKRNDIRLVRLINDGSTIQKKIVFSPSQGINKKFNPALRDGDVIIVPKNLLAKTTTTLKFAVEPIRPIINAASLYKILNRD
tara:strand:- start:3237 stop:4331 length:1095 start_codon:yes stop_codon:yes gene_type:complete